MTAKNTAVLILYLAVIIFLFIKGLIFVLHASEKKLERWAKKRGFVLLMSDPETLSDNPLLQGTSRNQELFRVKVRAADGSIRTGFVRLGSVYGGIVDDYFEEFWDDSKPA